MIKFVSITSPYDIKFEAEIINRLFEEGLEELHIRKPSYNKSDTIAFIKKINSAYHHKIVLYHHYQLVHLFDVKAIHLDYDFQNNALLNWFLKKIVLRGKQVKTYYTVSHCSHIKKYASKVDTVLLGPIYTKISKESYQASMDMEKLHHTLSALTSPVMLMGGINIQNYAALMQYDIEAIALQTYIWKSTDPIQSFKEIVAHSKAPQSNLKLKVI